MGRYEAFVLFGVQKIGYKGFPFPRPETYFCTALGHGWCRHYNGERANGAQDIDHDHALSTPGSLS